MSESATGINTEQQGTNVAQNEMGKKVPLVMHGNGDT